MSKARVRVELRNNYFDDKMAAFQKMFKYFKKVCQEAGIAHTYKESARYESPSRKKRRKEREAESLRQRNQERRSR